MRRTSSRPHLYRKENTHFPWWGVKKENETQWNTVWQPCTDTNWLSWKWTNLFCLMPYRRFLQSPPVCVFVLLPLSKTFPVGSSPDKNAKRMPAHCESLFPTCQAQNALRLQKPVVGTRHFKTLPLGKVFSACSSFPHPTKLIILSRPLRLILTLWNWPDLEVWTSILKCFTKH